jgi:hypothetical protein
LCVVVLVVLARLIFEYSDVEGEFSDKSEHEEECDDNTQPVTSSWKVYRHYLLFNYFM